MQSQMKLRAVGLFTCALALTAAHHQGATEALMVTAANRFVESLNDRFQRPMTVFQVRRRRPHELALFPRGRIHADARI